MITVIGTIPAPPPTARKRGGANSKRRIRYIPSEPGSVALQTAGDILDLLEGEINMVLELEPSHQRARTVGYLAGYALKALEVCELDARLEALEAAITGGEVRSDNGRY